MLDFSDLQKIREVLDFLDLQNVCPLDWLDALLAEQGDLVAYQSDSGAADQGIKVHRSVHLQ